MEPGGIAPPLFGNYLHRTTTMSLLTFDERKKMAVWTKGRIIPNYLSGVWRWDDYGNVIRYDDYGDRASAHG